MMSVVQIEVKITIYIKYKIASQHTPNKTHHVRMASSLDEERIDVCKQELIIT